MRSLWAVAFALTGCSVLASLVAAVISGTAGSGTGGVPVMVAAAVLLVLLLLALAALRQRYGAADAAAAERARHIAEVQRRAEEGERRGDEREAQFTGQLTALAETVDHLVSVQLPAAFNGTAVPPSRPDSAAAGHREAAALCDRVVAAAAGGAAKARQGLEYRAESSRLAVVTLARRVQASAHRIQEEATRMAERHAGDADVLESSMRVDHAAAQQARHAQSVAVLCAEWPGQQWPQPLALVDVARAASSRIVPYRRVTVSGEPDTGAAAEVVEPLIHLVAELLANATQSSPPSTQVLVTVRTVQRGAVIEIDDGGVGMEEHRLERAREIVSGQRLVGLDELGEIPQTGLAVVGQYVRRHGLRVDLMPSPYGGVRAVVLVPAEMVEILEPAVPAPPPQPAALEAGRTVEEPIGVPPAAGRPTGSLPQRRSRRGESASLAGGAPPSTEPGAPPSSAMPTPEQAGAWMAAFIGGPGDTGTAGSAAPADPGDAVGASPGEAAGDEAAASAGQAQASPSGTEGPAAN